MGDRNYSAVWNEIGCMQGMSTQPIFCLFCPLLPAGSASMHIRSYTMMHCSSIDHSLPVPKTLPGDVGQEPSGPRRAPGAGG